jgi:hypothetical protein
MTAKNPSNKLYKICNDKQTQNVPYWHKNSWSVTSWFYRHCRPYLIGATERFFYIFSLVKMPPHIAWYAINWDVTTSQNHCENLVDFPIFTYRERDAATVIDLTGENIQQGGRNAESLFVQQLHFFQTVLTTDLCRLDDNTIKEQNTS